MLLGVYRHDHPLRTLRKERTLALAKEALRQKIDLIFFDTKGINFNAKKVTGKMYNGRQWMKKTVPFPEAMINELPRLVKNRTKEEIRLRKVIPFTTYLIAGKIGIYEKLLKHGKLKNLVIPSGQLNMLQDVMDWFKQFEQIVIKPVNGRQGKGIFFIHRKEDGFIVKDHTTEKIFDQERFALFIDTLIKKKVHTIQPYINCRTSKGEPYDFRIHVQRDGFGKWVVTKVYPRMGDAESILSNISRGGRTEDIDTFLSKEFSEYPSELKDILEETGINIAEFINDQYKFEIDELGIDLAIDDNIKMWLYEVNTGPQTKFHEEERAINTIAYAKYIAQKHKNYFQNTRPTVAFFGGKKNSTALKLACQHVADSLNINYYYFTPSGINYDTKTIEGYTYEGGKPICRKFAYPDVIYDRFRMKGFKKYANIYEELSNIPMTNERPGNSVSKQEMYEKIITQNKFTNYLLPYTSLDSELTLFQFLGKYKKVIVKHSKGSFGQSIYLVEELSNGTYKITFGNETKQYSQEELILLYDEKWKENYLIQQFIVSVTRQGRPFDIRVHLMKDGKQQWCIAQKYARIGMKNTVVSNLAAGGHMMNFGRYLEENIVRDQQGILQQEIEDLSLAFALSFHELYEERINEIGLDIAIDENGQIWLFEVNINRPDSLFHEFEVAEHAIPYALSLIKST